MRICFSFFIITLLVGTSCRDRGEDQVPYVPVNIAININQPDFFDLTVPTGWVYVTGGSRGIIVYRNSNEEFTALERHSTYNVSDECAVAVDDDGVLITDLCSSSKWLIHDGSLVQGPASLPLIQYETNFQDPYLYITN
ncbi:MAG: hypothetical protein ACKVOR_14040 [Flavobacteriales bacterium]